MDMREPKKFIVEPFGGLRGTLTHDVDMSRHLSWRAGGRAERTYRPADLDDLCAFLRALPPDEPVTAVGLGSNLLIRDGGLRGTVLLMHAALSELRLVGEGIVYAQAGVPGAKLARFAALHDLAGAQFFAGIPGTMGGMLAMNAGCYGSATWERVMRVQTVRRDGTLRERSPAEYEIGYRHVVRLPDPGMDEWFTAARLYFSPGDGAASREAIRELLSRRIASQPLHLPNAGSVFRNPPNDHAARLIESCGLKGKRIGGARVSEKHANFIVNAGGATAADIENLITEVRETVKRETGIDLHPEVRIVGDKA
ncbi:MAG: UDP-N-acetylmuramate dehydrogenase [Gallionellaceae bacterium]|nr:UDP-N-acetylmuramate dehydrogenase [Gallionellaceae bacterium]